MIMIMIQINEKRTMMMTMINTDHHQWSMILFFFSLSLSVFIQTGWRNVWFIFCCCCCSSAGTINNKMKWNGNLSINQSINNLFVENNCCFLFVCFFSYIWQEHQSFISIFFFERWKWFFCRVYNRCEQKKSLKQRTRHKSSYVIGIIDRENIFFYEQECLWWWRFKCW